MTNLFIDDHRQAPDDSWTLATSNISAINAIEQFDFDVISFDHDITHPMVVKLGHNEAKYELWGCPENFKAAAKYLVLKYKGVEKKPKIILHTSNPAGADELKLILVDFECERNLAYTQ